MKQLILLFSLCSFFVQLWAQDTTVVQTLTWQDDNRSGYYTFPDNPDDRYRKIIMRYNMRCHDDAVGNGNVGCREWDYSCNTFITDPTRVDSTRAFHPNYVIPGFSGDQFLYTSQPVYEYNQYEQQQTQFEGVTLLNLAEIGSGVSSLYLGLPEGGTREQYLYQKDELLAAGLEAGPISAMELNTATTGGTADFLRIRLQNVQQDALSELAPVTDGFTEVYFQTTTFDTDGWAQLPFYQDFEWDGESSILVEFVKTGASPEPDIRFYGGSTSFLSGASPIGNDKSYLELSGSSFIEVPEEALGFTSDITIAFWSYGFPEALPANTTILEARDANNQRQVNIHLPWSNGSVYWDCGNDGSGYDRIFKEADPEDYEGKWTHWAFTKSTTTGEMAIYINGTLWHSEMGKVKNISEPVGMKIGTDFNGNNAFPGSIDQLSMWASALSEEEIQQMMYVSQIPVGHPQYNQLVLHYPMSEGQGLELSDAANDYHGSLLGPKWKTHRGNELRLDWVAIQDRFNIRFQQSEQVRTNEIITVVDTSLASPFTVIDYGVDADNGLIVEDVFQTNAAGWSYLYDAVGNAIDSFEVQPEGTLDIQNLTYFQKQAAKFEILSLVTPYGNGLDLGAEGKTFYFDVTDYEPILKGEKFMSLEMGGQNQEEMDIQFWFIKGTPPREIMEVQNIWPFRRGWYAELQEDRYFEPRSLTLHPDADAYKLRSAVTGHGQNGEFVPRNHYLNINGGAQEFVYQVWKECGNIPIYPQGGTWLFDRAGWCPGHPTDVHQFGLEDYNPDDEIEIDYGVNGAFMSEANYLVSNQLVTYGAPNFEVDAAIEAIVRPSSRVEFERFNPMCSQPIVVVQNTGAATVTQLEIAYGIQGGATEVYEWEGTLEFLDTVHLTLPAPGLSFWNSANDSEIGTFFALIGAVNGAPDEYQDNNVMSSDFEMPTVFEFEELLQFHFRTNNRASENRYTFRDESGNIVLERDNMENATLYKDDIELPPGCYTLHVEDSGDDGLYYWYWEATNQGVGSGSAVFKRYINDNLQLSVRSFESEFGSSIFFDFVLPMTSSNEHLQAARRLSVYPNPASSHLQVELQGFDSQELLLQLYNLTGQLIQEVPLQHTGQAFIQHQMDISTVPSGLYLLKIQGENKVWTREVVKQ
jgi:hypothetical protein